MVFFQNRADQSVREDFAVGRWAKCRKNSTNGLDYADLGVSGLFGNRFFCLSCTFVRKMEFSALDNINMSSPATVTEEKKNSRKFQKVLDELVF